MKLMVASYNNGIADWNAEAEETAFISYRLSAALNEPAECHITLADPTGIIIQKYNVDANDVYIGPGKATVENPVGTDIFYGRIVRVTGNSQSRTVELYCQDWLSQLDEEQVTYDMREDLDGSGTRESTIRPDYDNTDGNGIGPANNVAGTKYVYDHDIGLTADAHNGQYMILSDEMAGDIRVTTGPYTYTTDGGTDIFTHDIGDLWTEDTDHHSVGDLGGAWYSLYNFKVWTPDSAWYVGCTGARIKMIIGLGDDVSVALYNGATYDILEENIGTIGSAILKKTIEIPNNLLSTMFDANGESRVKFVDADTGGIEVYYLAIQCEFQTTGYGSAIAISDGETYRLTVATDLSADATKVWDGLPYSIARPIYKHIDSAETPGHIVTDGDVLVTLTCAAGIEHTSGISTRQYKNLTRYDIMRDLARQDKAEFWLDLGTVTLHWKSTWDAAIATETLSDAEVMSWTARYDYGTLINKAVVDGMRVGDRQLSSNYSSAASIAKYIATRTKVEQDSGLLSEYDCLERATAIVNQYSGVQMMVTATLSGNALTAAHANTLALANEIKLNSTYLGLANVWYIVHRIEYDSERDATTVDCHPRVSATGLQRSELRNLDSMQHYIRRGGSADKYIPAPTTDVVP